MTRMEIVNWVDPTWLDAWMVMFVRGMEDRGVPDMIPVDEWNDRPIGRDPDIMENDRSSPLTIGEIENGLSFDRAYEDWE